MKKLDILNAFINSELEARQTGESGGSWYVMNWSKLKKEVIASAPGLLDAERLSTLYSTLIGKALLYDDPIKDNYAEWEEAYRRHTPFMVRTAWQNSSSISRLHGLVLFGFDQSISVSKNSGYQDYHLYRQAWKGYGNNMPDMLKRADRLLPWANNKAVVKRFTDALKGLNFIIDDWYGITTDDESYQYLNLEFFHILLMFHMSDSPLAKQTLEEFKARLPSLPKAAEQAELLTRCQQASTKYFVKQALA